MKINKNLNEDALKTNLDAEVEDKLQATITPTYKQAIDDHKKNTKNKEEVMADREEAIKKAFDNKDKKIERNEGSKQMHLEESLFEDVDEEEEDPRAEDSDVFTLIQNELIVPKADGYKSKFQLSGRPYDPYTTFIEDSATRKKYIDRLGVNDNDYAILIIRAKGETEEARKEYLKRAKDLADKLKALYGDKLIFKTYGGHKVAVFALKRVDAEEDDYEARLQMDALTDQELKQLKNRIGRKLPWRSIDFEDTFNYAMKKAEDAGDFTEREVDYIMAHKDRFYPRNEGLKEEKEPKKVRDAIDLINGKLGKRGYKIDGNKLILNPNGKDSSTFELTTQVVNRLKELGYNGLKESKELNEGTSNFLSQKDLPLFAWVSFEDELDNAGDLAQEEYKTEGKGEFGDEGWEEFLEKFEEDYLSNLESRGYVLVDETKFDEIQDRVDEFNFQMERLSQDAYEKSEKEEDEEKAENWRDASYALDDVRLEIKPGYYQGYQLYLNGEDSIPDEYRDEIVRLYRDAGKGLMELKVAWRASNGETSYDIVKKEVEEESLQEKKDTKGDEVRAWWDRVEKWNKENGNEFHIDNTNASDEDLFVAMYDMVKELKDKAKDLYKDGKKIYNKYATSKIVENIEVNEAIIWGRLDKVDDVIEYVQERVDNGEDKEVAIQEEIDRALIYDEDILELAKYYGVIDYRELVDRFYENFYNEVYGAIEDKDESTDDEFSDLEDQLNVEFVADDDVTGFNN